MNDVVHEWITKAEADYHSALREYRARKHPNYDSAGFHAQQWIEKYLKAFLIFSGLPAAWGHDLLALAEKCLPALPALELEKPLLALLTKFAVRYRYPGESATKDEARDALNAMKQLREFMRSQLVLPE